MDFGFLLAQTFAQHALLAAALVAVASGLISPFVVTRGMAFAVHGTAELAFTGAAAGPQTTLLPASRLTFSIARDKVFPRVFSKVQGRFQTPMIGTLILASLCLFGIFLRAISPAVNNGYGNLIADIGVLVAFYYGATGITCAWSYRKAMLASVRFFFAGVLLPFLSGCFCFWVGYQVITQSTAGAALAAPVGALAAAVGLSRVVNGVHFPSDIAGGFAVGVGVGMLTLRWWPLRRPEPAAGPRDEAPAAPNPAVRQTPSDQAGQPRMI